MSFFDGASFPPLAQRGLWKLLQTYFRALISFVRIDGRAHFSRVAYLCLSQGHRRRQHLSSRPAVVVGMSAVVGDAHKLPEWLGGPETDSVVIPEGRAAAPLAVCLLPKRALSTAVQGQGRFQSSLQPFTPEMRAYLSWWQLNSLICAVQWLDGLFGVSNFYHICPSAWIFSWSNTVFVKIMLPIITGFLKRLSLSCWVEAFICVLNSLLPHGVCSCPHWGFLGFSLPSTFFVM